MAIYKCILSFTINDISYCTSILKVNIPYCYQYK